MQKVILKIHQGARRQRRLSERCLTEPRQNVAAEMLITLAALSYERRPLLQDPFSVILANRPALRLRIVF